MKINYKIRKKYKIRRKFKKKKKIFIINFNLICIFFGIISIFKFGYLGKFINNILIFLFGYFFLFFNLIFLILYNIVNYFKNIFFYENKKIIKKINKLLIIFFIIYLQLLLLGHIYIFEKMYSNKYLIIFITLNRLINYLNYKCFSIFNIGTGFIGALLFEIYFFLFGKNGSYIVSYIIIFYNIILLILFFLKLEKLMELLKKYFKKIILFIIKKIFNLIYLIFNLIKKIFNLIYLIIFNLIKKIFNLIYLIFNKKNIYKKNIIINNKKKQKNIYINNKIVNNNFKKIYYKFPNLELLDKVIFFDQKLEIQRIKKNILILKQTFKNFGVKVKVLNANLGPTITKFEIQPSIGVKVNKILNLSNDISLALAVKDIRIETPIAGKSLIGIEIPNFIKNKVFLKELFEFCFKNNKFNGKLDIILGKDMYGKVKVIDLVEMPHILIAGATGSGKSVTIHEIILSILLRFSPEKVKLILIDPKLVELNVYNNIPNLLFEVISDLKIVNNVFNRIVKEMKIRYNIFAKFNVRNIEEFNLLNKKNKNIKIIPFIVIIVDELADLFLNINKEIEISIIRLAQMARASGIHMILSTQRPSVDVITGLIKANIPARIAFSVFSNIDSRTIIDCNGAEKLLGCGDMLFLSSNCNKLIRIQSAFVSSNEINRIVNFLINNNKQFNYKKNDFKEENIIKNEIFFCDDNLYEKAKFLVLKENRASISLLQRYFRIGYNRAGRLIDALEKNNIIGPYCGSKSRKIIENIKNKGI